MPFLYSRSGQTDSHSLSSELLKLGVVLKLGVNRLSLVDAGFLVLVVRIVAYSVDDCLAVFYSRSVSRIQSRDGVGARICTLM